MIFQHKKKCKEIFIISEIYLVFHPQNEGPSCLQGACGCLNTNTYKKCSIFHVFFNKHCFKNPTLLLLKGGSPLDPNPHFLESVAQEN